MMPTIYGSGGTRSTIPWGLVNAQDTAVIAARVGLEKARERGKWSCPSCGSTDNLHAYAPGRGFFCFGCREKFSNVDLASTAWQVTPVEACRELAALLGLSMDPGRDYTRRPTPRVARSTESPQARNLAAVRAAAGRLPHVVYGDVLRRLTVTCRGAAYLNARALQGGEQYGFRSIDSPPAWDRLRTDLLDTYSPEEVRAAGLLRLPWAGRHPALVIPYWFRGVVIGLRFRSLHPGASHGERYCSLKNAQPLLPFNADALDAEVVHVAEGDLNAYTLHLHGLAAVGIPGAAAWKPEWTRRLSGARRVFAWFDADRAGQAGLRALMVALGRRVEPVTLPAGKDANDLHREGELHAYLP